VHGLSTTRKSALEQRSEAYTTSKRAKNRRYDPQNRRMGHLSIHPKANCDVCNTEKQKRKRFLKKNLLLQDYSGLEFLVELCRVVNGNYI
jgi:hypothetical protein